MVIYESYSMERKMWMARFVLEACKYNGPFILFCFNHIKIMMVVKITFHCERFEKQLQNCQILIVCNILYQFVDTLLLNDIIILKQNNTHCFRL